MSFSLRRKRYHKQKWGRCPKGHRYCDDKCDYSRLSQKLAAIADEYDSEGHNYED